MIGWNLIRLQHARSEATSQASITKIFDIVKTFLRVFLPILAVLGVLCYYSGEADRPPDLPLFSDGALAQLARAPALQAGGQEFESLMLHQTVYKIFFIYSAI